MKLLKRFENFSNGHDIPTIDDFFGIVRRRNILVSDDDFNLFNGEYYQAGFTIEDTHSDQPICNEDDIETLGHPNLDITWVRVRVGDFSFIVFFQDGDLYATAAINLRIKRGQTHFYKGPDGEMIEDKRDEHGFFLLFEDIVLIIRNSPGGLERHKVTSLDLMSDKIHTKQRGVSYNHNVEFELEGGEYKFFVQERTSSNQLFIRCESESSGKIHEYFIDKREEFNLLKNPKVTYKTWSEFDLPSVGELYKRIMDNDIKVTEYDKENVIIGKALDPNKYSKHWTKSKIYGTKILSGAEIKPLDSTRHYAFFEVGDHIGSLPTYNGESFGFFFGLYEDKKLKSLVYVGENGGFLKTFGILVVVTQWSERFEFTTISLMDGQPINHFEEYYDEEEITFQHDDVEFIFDTYGGILTSTNESGETESFDMEKLSWNKMTKPT